MLLRHLIVGLFASLMFGNPTLALDPINSTGADHLAIRGTDTTAYFKKGGPAKGSGSHVVLWKGASWRFGSAQEASLFRANPTAYAPQFGAYCTGGLSQQHVVEGKPQHWR
ncbi:MAG: YHS domain-containing (seleno)protein, partial [Hyphomicrobiales bacterium]